MKLFVLYDKESNLTYFTWNVFFLYQRIVVNIKDWSNYDCIIEFLKVFSFQMTKIHKLKEILGKPQKNNGIFLVARPLRGG